jgi:hypothetical protein
MPNKDLDDQQAAELVIVPMCRRASPRGLGDSPVCWTDAGKSRLGWTPNKWDRSLSASLRLRAVFCIGTTHSGYGCAWISSRTWLQAGRAAALRRL